MKISCPNKKFKPSEGGTGEDWRIDPHLNFGTTIVIIFGKVGSDPLLDKKKIRSSPR